MITASDRSVIERAYEFARDGSCKDVAAVRKKLKRAGFRLGEIDDHLHGRTLTQQLARLCQEARERMANAEL